MCAVGQDCTIDKDSESYTEDQNVSFLADFILAFLMPLAVSGDRGERGTNGNEF